MLGVGNIINNPLLIRPSKVLEKEIGSIGRNILTLRKQRLMEAVAFIITTILVNGLTLSVPLKKIN